MNTRRTVCIVVAGVFALGSVGVLKGAFFAHDFVTTQLDEQNIEFGAADGARDKDWYDAHPAAKAFAGQEVKDGWQARQFAEYIGHHVEEAMKTYNATYHTNITTYSEASDEARSDAVTKGTDKDRATAATNLRRTALDGQLLRGTLLNTYGWWWIGTIALWAGWIMVILAVLSLVAAFVPMPTRKAATSTGVATEE
jgi:hypothetical protein